MKSVGIYAVALLLILAFSVQSHAAVYELETFDGAITPEWSSRDRTLPSTVEFASFQGDSRLHYVLDKDAEGAGVDFYRYEGIKHGVNMHQSQIQTFSIDMYINDYDTFNSGMWAQGLNNSGGTSAWSILSYRKGGTDPSGFYFYDYINGAWILGVEMETSNTWHNLSFTLTQGVGYEYFVDGVSVGTFADIETYDMTNLILNAVNDATVNKDIYFDNFKATATPIPGAIYLLGSGLFGLIGVRNRKKFLRS